MASEQSWTILKTLEWVQGYFAEKGLESPRLDAEVLIAHVLQTQRVMLYARFDQPLQAPELAAIKGLVARRARREPVAHLVGRKEFWSLDLVVNQDCLIPRPDSETIVEVAVALGKATAIERAVDVGTGSGCLALALAQELKGCTVWALEMSEAALAVARTNVEKTELADRVTVLQSDLLQDLPAESQPVDLMVANLPYIPSDDIDSLMPDVRFFEPRQALDGGEDGLTLYRRLIDQLGGVMAPGASVVFEAGADQMDELAALLKQAGLTGVEIHLDAAERPRVVSGRT